MQIINNQWRGRGGREEEGGRRREEGRGREGEKGTERETGRVKETGSNQTGNSLGFSVPVPFAATNSLSSFSTDSASNCSFTVTYTCSTCT